MAACALAILGLLLAAPAMATSFHTATTFQAGTGALSAGLAADAQGRLYGASEGGGAFDEGFIYRLTPGAAKSDPWTVETLHDFRTTDGATPAGRLTIGPSGEVYGTTFYGGTYFLGTVFRLDNVAGWPITTLHAFAASDPGVNPRGSVVFGPNGLLYGTTSVSSKKDKFTGDLFALSPLGDSVSYAILHEFSQAPGPDGGYQPNDDLVVAPNGEIYGTTGDGGLTARSAGVFFKLSQKAGGVWQYTNLHDFISSVGDFFPFDPVRASDGTYYGCSSNEAAPGSVYALAPPRPGTAGWTESTVTLLPIKSGSGYTDCQAVAVMPSGGLVTATAKYSFDFPAVQTSGRVLKLLPPAAPGAKWTTSEVHAFHPPGAYAYFPLRSLLRVGGLYYGVTPPEGFLNGGTVYDVRP